MAKDKGKVYNFPGMGPNRGTAGADSNDQYDPANWDWGDIALGGAPPPATGGRSSSGPTTRGGRGKAPAAPTGPAWNLGGSLFGPAWWYNLFSNQGGQTLAQQAAGMVGQGAGVPHVIPSQNIIPPGGGSATAAAVPAPWFAPTPGMGYVPATGATMGTGTASTDQTINQLADMSNYYQARDEFIKGLSEMFGQAGSYNPYRYNPSLGHPEAGWYDPYSGRYLWGGPGSSESGRALYFSPNYGTGGVTQGYGPGMRIKGSSRAVGSDQQSVTASSPAVR